MEIIVRRQGRIGSIADRGELPAVLAEPDSLVWVDAKAPADDELIWLSRTFGLHDLALEDTVNQAQRPKAEIYDDHIFVVVHAVKPGNKRLNHIELYFFVGRNYIVSIRHEPFAPLDQFINDAPKSRYLRRGPDFVLYAAMDMAVDTYFPAIDKIEDDIDKLDELVLGRPSQEIVERLLNLKHQLVTLRKLVSPQREVVNSLISRDYPFIAAETVFYLRDVYDHLLRIYDDIDLSRDLIAGDMDIYLSNVSNSLNEVMKRLTVFASIFMPITFITGFFGMNFGYIQDRSAWWWPVATVLIGVVAGLNYWWFSKRKWV